MKFTVYGKIKGKPRPRVTTVGGHAHAYSPKSYQGYEESISSAYMNAGGHVLSGSISIKVQSYRMLPTSTAKRITSEPDTKKPDADNILKSVMDALNGIAYRDDAQVVDATVIKMPRTRIEEEYLEIEIVEKGQNDE